MNITRFGLALVFAATLSLGAAAHAEEAKKKPLMLAQSNCETQCSQQLQQCRQQAQNFINQGQPNTTQPPCYDDCQYAIDYSCQQTADDCKAGC